MATWICLRRLAHFRNTAATARSAAILADPRSRYVCTSCAALQSEDSMKFEPPYPNYTKEERHYLYKGIVDEQVHLLEKPTPPVEVDPTKQPYDEVYADGPDRKNFTQVEVVTEKQPQLWFWVERLLPKNQAPTVVNEGQPFTTGYIPPPQQAPELPYFVPRTRSKVLPVYKVVLGKDNSVLTQIQNIDGDIRQLERDLRRYLIEKQGSQRILSAVHEGKGLLKFKGNYVNDVVSWLHSAGF